MRIRRDIEVANIRACLTQTQQWVCWKYAIRKGKETKLPMDAKSLTAANVVDPASWCSFEKALSTYQKSPSLDGVAFAFSEWDAFAGVDLDDCLNSDGQFTWGQDIVSQLDSYYEISPSGLGVKLFLRGVKPASAQCRVDGLGDKAIGKLEIYDRARCFAVTGRRIEASPIDVMPRQEQLESLCNRLWPAKNGLAATRPINPIETSMPASARALKIWDCIVER